MFRRYLTLGLITLIVCLWWGKIVTAQPKPNSLVQKGVELYQQGQVIAAIESWHRALNSFSEDKQLDNQTIVIENLACLLYTSPSPRDATLSRMPSSA